MVGQLSDLAVSVAYMFPPVVGFVVQRGRWEPFALTGRWADVVDISGPAIRLGVGIQALTPSKLDTPGEILVHEALLDKQIVDMSGAKVVRVNDLHFLKLGRTSCAWCTSTSGRAAWCAAWDGRRRSTRSSSALLRRRATSAPSA